MATLYTSVAASTTWRVSRGDVSCSGRPVVQSLMSLSPRLCSARNGVLKSRGNVTIAASNEEVSEKNVPLWRKELTSLEDPSGENLLQNASMEEDIARLQKKRALEKQIERYNKRQELEEEKPGEGAGVGGLKSVMERILVADFFFILFILAWLVAGLVERSVLESTTLIDSWLPLWAIVFQPALGLFMAGGNRVCYLWVFSEEWKQVRR